MSENFPGAKLLGRLRHHLNLIETECSETGEERTSVRLQEKALMLLSIRKSRVTAAPDSNRSYNMCKLHVGYASSLLLSLECTMASQETLISTESEALPDPTQSPIVTPDLGRGERHHVFISYSSLDSSWAHTFIARLESSDLGLKVCHHERDFIAGKSVMDNMADCIRASQKVVLVLSEDFLRSRWCLLEANLSLFQDCSQGKPVIPILLQPCVIPLHLKHLTYLDVQDPQFYKKLIDILCIPNHFLRNTMGPLCQPASVYEGKLLATVYAVNEEIPQWASGVFSKMGPPGQLEMVADSYREAIEMINNVAAKRSLLQPLWLRVILSILLILIAVVSANLAMAFCVGAFTFNKFSLKTQILAGLLFFFNGIVLFPILIQKVICWGKQEGKTKLNMMQKIAGQVNILMSQQNVLLSCKSRTCLLAVYVPLDGCREAFLNTFPGALGDEMYLRALLNFSPGYALCVAKKHFAFPLDVIDSSRSHMEVGACFCQYVSQQLRQDMWS
ncbi:uncharacterized protein LOC120538248 [Polypterus senegalus]|uniref:uncharacterized protein LOC120538248 n=1 Tax=Polypterus senegalus TaxID=55291 RepID=UPI001962FB2C|nr:uncharacterized protein LOC120538248 [Polypterus senegalus]